MRRHPRDAERGVKRRRRRPRVPPLAAGALAAVVILAVCWLVFGGPTPFGSSTYRLKAVFTAETELHLESPVRVAGVNVGKVVAIHRVGGSSPATVVTMTVDHAGLPIHSDATIQVRPRLFLEGNYYVALSPGTPAAPVLRSGALLPAAHSSGPVQLDRVLSSLTANVRGHLQTLIEGFGDTLNEVPPVAADRSADPSQRGLTAAQSLRESLDYSAAAFRASALVDQALLGRRPHDLSGSVTGLSKTFAGLAASGSHLSGLVGSLDGVMGALARRQRSLSQTLARLPGALRSANAAVGPLQASFGPTRTFAREILPGVRRLGPTITAALPWLAQSRTLFSKPDLGDLLADLTPAVQDTSATVASTRTLLGGSDELARCLNHTIIPTGEEKISDPPVTTGLKDYQELLQSAVGIASAAQDFDGNGRYVRSTTGGGADRQQTGPLPGQGPLYGNFVDPSLGTRPAFDATPPPKVRSVQCLREAPPDLNAAKTGAGP